MRSLKKLNLAAGTKFTRWSQVETILSFLQRTADQRQKEALQPKSASQPSRVVPVVGNPGSKNKENE